ncbi:cryptochrome/photolyase family protein [Rubritalea spongiae]|uniref:Cryptochrome/photolyase family protein n=1 Tax=Rubritalea spongiae TaxID=430797 RepID=A0ABW5E8R7_9BACT
MKSCILWFRKDLRLSDHPALDYAIEEGYSILPLYIFEDAEAWPMGEASRWWLHHALMDLGEQLDGFGAKLHIVDGSKEAHQTLSALVKKIDADAVFWSRRYEAESILQDSEIKKELMASGVLVKSFSASLINEPFNVSNQSGKPYKVFTPYWKKCREIPLRELTQPDLSKASWQKLEDGLTVEELELLPSLSWDDGFYEMWDPHRSGAASLLNQLGDGRAAAYSENRDMLAESGTSRLSPYLAFGQISPIEIIHALSEVKAEDYLRQLYWRDFSYHLLYHFPKTDKEPLREEWRLFPWGVDEKIVGKWQRGETGYPVVDAAMRELWHTGWMHNRARMIVASVLVKHFQQDWMVGAQWFWDTLVDADLANNTMGWQWSAGCGADAAPYFRVFNPVTQGQKFDPDGIYIRKYVPELSALPNKYIYCPWEAPSALLEDCGIVLGQSYPQPILLPSEGRKMALDAYQAFKNSLEARQG